MKLLATILSLTVMGTAAADFAIVNETGRSFEAVYFTAGSNKDWDGNILGNGKPLAAGGRFTVKFRKGANSEEWDLKIVDDEGLAVTFRGVKLDGHEKLTLKEAGGKITAEIE